MKLYLAKTPRKTFVFKDLSNAFKKVREINGYLRIVDGGYINDDNGKNESRKYISSK